MTVNEDESSLLDVFVRLLALMLALLYLFGIAWNAVLSLFTLFDALCAAGLLFRAIPWRGKSLGMNWRKFDNRNAIVNRRFAMTCALVALVTADQLYLLYAQSPASTRPSIAIILFAVFLLAHDTCKFISRQRQLAKKTKADLGGQG